MKVAIVNSSDTGGGAERIASGLAVGLRGRGHDVAMLCGRTSGTGNRQLTGAADWVLGRTLKRIGFADAISLAAHRFLSFPEVRDADVIHFHNLHGFYFGVASLPKIAAAKPCVWTLHDGWALSGGCYTQTGCDGWLLECRRCPAHGVHPMTGILDTAAPMLRLKRRAFAALTHHGGQVTGVSDWMTGRIRQAFRAAQLPEDQICCVRNHVPDLPDDGTAGDVDFPIVAGGPILLLMAADVNNRLKGAVTALAALRGILPRPYTLLTVGHPFPDRILREFGLAERTVQLGYVGDRNRLAAIYRRAHVTIVPSVSESFGLVAAESIRCGTPVVASNVGALPEIVLDGITGYLAMVGDPNSFATQISRIIDAPASAYAELCRSTERYAREHLITENAWLDRYEGVYDRAVAAHRQ